MWYVTHTQLLSNAIHNHHVTPAPYISMHYHVPSHIHNTLTRISHPSVQLPATATYNYKSLMMKSFPPRESPSGARNCDEVCGEGWNSILFSQVKGGATKLRPWMGGASSQYITKPSLSFIFTHDQFFVVRNLVASFWS